MHNLEFNDLLGSWKGVVGNAISFFRLTENRQERGKLINFDFNYKNGDETFDVTALVHFEYNNDPFLVIDQLHYPKDESFSIDKIKVWNYKENQVTLLFPNGQFYELHKL